MQDALIGGWARWAGFSAQTLAPLYDLNAKFLDILVAHAGGWGTGGAPLLPEGASERVRPLSATQRAAAAHCPYALFDLRFQDEAHWHARLRGAGDWRVSDGSAEEDTANFVRLALFYAWHVAATSRYAARLLLGMSERTAAAFRAATLNCLPALATSEAATLTARFGDCGAYWSALVGAAARSDGHRLRRVQLFGLQLAAASLLP